MFSRQYSLRRVTVRFRLQIYYVSKLGTGLLGLEFWEQCTISDTEICRSNLHGKMRGECEFASKYGLKD